MANHNITDALLKVTATLPNAANTVNSNSIDLGATTPFPTTDKINVRLSQTAATGANSKNVNIRVQDSADNASFANVAVIANPVLRTANDGSNYAAANVVISLPPTIRRYVRAVAVGEANGGDASDGTFSIEILA